MKTKQIYTFLAVLILASLACQTPADANQPTRVAAVQTAQPSFATPDNWAEAPKACLDSLTQVGFSVDGVGVRASGSIIETETIIWKNKEYFLYYVLTTDHYQNGFDMGSSVSLSAGFNSRFDYEYVAVDSLVITDALGRETEAEIVAVIGETKAVTPLNESPQPIGSNNMISGIGIPRDAYYYTIGYQMGSWLPQFVKSQVVDSYKDPVFLYTTMTFKITSDSQTIPVNGMSGGPTCNSSGQIVGVYVSHDGNLGEFFVTPLPFNISEQYSSLKLRVDQIIQSP